MLIAHRYYNEKSLIVEIDSIDGALIEEDVDRFVEEILKLVPQLPGKIAFDMSRKRYLNSSGLGELIFIKDRLTDAGAELVLLGVTENVSSLLEMVGLDEFFTVLSSEDQIL